MDDDHPINSAARGRSPGSAPAPQPGTAERALAEAKERRAAAKRDQVARPREIDGRQGPEPVRYGDWENKGIAYDF